MIWSGICDYVARERAEAARRLALDVLRAIDGLRFLAAAPPAPITTNRSPRGEVACHVETLRTIRKPMTEAFGRGALR